MRWTRQKEEHGTGLAVSFIAHRAAGLLDTVYRTVAKTWEINSPPSWLLGLAIDCWLLVLEYLYSHPIMVGRNWFAALALMGLGVAQTPVSSQSVVPSGIPIPGNYNGPLRPQVHYSPPKGFLNDPNGMFVDVNGTWHMYYQCKTLGLERN